MDKPSAGRFALELFTRWQRNAALGDGLWTLRALGLFGGDDAAHALDAFVRREAERRPDDAVYALECLRAIGSDVAVTLLVNLARTSPSPACAARAAGCVEQIAVERNLTRDGLEDCSVPEQDFPDGAIARTQCDRLEAAMIEQRRWSQDDFVTLLLRNPIAGPLARRLVWEAEDASVRLVHRIELDERELATWEARLASERIVPPFAQLDRLVYRLDDIELTAVVIRRFDGVSVTETSLRQTLRDRGWRLGAMRNGGYDHHVKRFERAGLTAVLFHDVLRILDLGRRPLGAVSFEGCTFVRGSARGERVRLRDVPAIAISEVCADCSYVLA